MTMGSQEQFVEPLIATGVKCAYGVSRDSHNAPTNPLKQLVWIFALVLYVVLPARGQQTDDVQKQIQQLKQQYEQTTRELQERIAALEQQLKKEGEAKEDPPKKQPVSEVELAIQNAAKVALGQSKENQSLQGQVPAAPTYDQLR